MDFLNVGPWELVLVLIIAILVAGPKRMVEIARTLGHVSRQLRDLSREFTTALQAEIQATEAEASKTGADLRGVRKGLEDALSNTPAARAEPSDNERVPASPSAQVEIQEDEVAPSADAGEGEDTSAQSSPVESESAESRDEE